jgi:hypothetical protein
MANHELRVTKQSELSYAVEMMVGGEWEFITEFVDEKDAIDQVEWFKARFREAQQQQMEEDVEAMMNFKPAGERPIICSRQDLEAAIRKAWREKNNG